MHDVNGNLTHEFKQQEQLHQQQDNAEYQSGDDDEDLASSYASAEGFWSATTNGTHEVAPSNEDYASLAASQVGSGASITAQPPDDITQAAVDAGATNLAVELMTSDEADFGTAHPGWPYCSMWAQSKNFVKFTVLFPNCHVTPATATATVDHANYCLVRCQTVDGTENHWGTRLWRGVVKECTDVIVADGAVQVQCQKEDVGLRWEKVGTARTRRF